MQTHSWTPPDQKARDRILHDLDTCLLVEAGAGSGKTTAMVGRMIELIRTGAATVDLIAAVTFTRKAASELKERFQEKLEAEYREQAGGGADPQVRERVARALESLDRCFVGTIHSFCGRLLRERPLEAGVPPNFEEVSGADEDRLRVEAWSRYVERLGQRDSRLVRRLADLGLRPAQLKDLYREVSDNSDVHYVSPPVTRPDRDSIQRVRAGLESLLEESLRLMPEEQPDAGWDGLQKKVRTLRFSRFFPGWKRDADFLDALSGALGTKNQVTQNRWGDDKETKKAAKALGERWDDFCAEGGAAHRLCSRWLACRYPVALRFARAGAGLFAAERRRMGRLNFQDLLMLSTRMLRSHPEVRAELGRRYRYLLVDEFQDTDPIQAEVVFLLASEPDGETHWSRARPRPGSLFVVGDPKQSIYRFRRADISVYGQVKQRFREIGDVLGLTANFRSTQPVERLVNRVFAELLPAEETAHQAAFASLAVKPEERPQQGVSWYRFEPAEGKGTFSGRRISGPESTLLASWIRERIERGERKAGDFMVLTRTKKQLSDYARALEARNVPVQVSGAGIGVEEELKDLILLLKALCDPGDPVLTLAVLEGVFFGISHEQMYRHVRAGGTFSLLRDDHPEGSEVGEALRELRRFWLLARNAPADVAVPQIVERLGILPHAAAGELGSTRAGALLYAMDALRVAGLDGATSLTQGIEVLETALEEEVEAPLFPGESDVVRVMNLHKAKGLEAPVVVLAFPAKESDHPIHRHISRDADGRAVGFLRVGDSTRRSSAPICSPPDWPAYEAAEAPFGAAEDVRLLYVAATRARDELVVGRCSRTEDGSVWSPLHAALDDPAIASELTIRERAPEERVRLEEDSGSLRRRIGEIEARRRRLDQPTYESASVTRRVKGPALKPARVGIGAASPSPGRGVEWGSAVHQALEVAKRGAVGLELRGACRGFLIEAERPLTEHGEPEELDELIHLVESLRRSALWRRAGEATRVLVEVPFLISFPAAEAGRLGLCGGGAAATQVVEGVIDLAFREPLGGWVIADYKTDVFPSMEIRRERTAAYRRQVDLYSLCWERLTGEPVKERVLFFTSEGREEVWQSASGSPEAATPSPLADA
jgi:ATP-dependent helicase/nuclease subunit A